MRTTTICRNRIAWFNNHRLMAALDYVPPAEFEANYYRNLEQQIIPV